MGTCWSSPEEKPKKTKGVAIHPENSRAKIRSRHSSSARVEPAPEKRSTGAAGGGGDADAEEFGADEGTGPGSDIEDSDEDDEDEIEIVIGKPEPGAALAQIEGPDGAPLPPEDVESLRRRWETAYPPPSSPPEIDPSPPDASLDLDWVYGFACRASRASLHYANDGNDIAYPAAALGVLYTTDSKSQRFLQGHTDDVISLAVHPNGKYVATGERGRWPVIMIWDSSTGEKVKELVGPLERGICGLTFSPGDGKYLVGAGMDDSNTMAVWEWEESGEVQWSEKGGGKGHTLGIAVSADGQTVAQTFNGLTTFHWKGKKSRRGLLGSKGKNQGFPCVEVHERGGREEFLVGTQDGRIYVFDLGGQLSRAVRVHKGTVYSLTVSRADGGAVPKGHVVTGGKDGKVRVWDSSLKKSKEMEVKGTIRHVDVHPSGDLVVMGTSSAQILEYNVADGSLVGGKPILDGHFREELWGLATHPDRSEFVTSGDDGTLRVWSIEDHSLLRTTKLEGRSRAIAYTPDGRHLIVGIGGRVGGVTRGRARREGEPEDGLMLLLKADTLEEVARSHDAKKPIQDIVTNGEVIAAASHDAKIYIYDASSLRLQHVFKKHSSTVTRMDLSTDGQKLQGCDTSGELLYTDVTTGDHILSSTDMANESWLTWRSIIGWHVRGAWPLHADGSDINAMSRSNDESMVATADDFGKVKIFRFPCPDPAGSLDGVGHGSHVTNVAWDKTDTYLLSAGGNDRCVLQWRVSKH